MKLLVIGGNGQVGHALTRALEDVGDVVVTTRSGRTVDEAACDVLDVSALDSIGQYIEAQRPDVVINATAYTAVDRAEDEPALAFAINADAAGRMAAACAQVGARFVHYSTDYVFDGQSTRPYREDDATAPLGVYGASKLAGEAAIAAAGGEHVILRTAWVYGWHGHNFFRTIRRLASEREVLKVVDDQRGAPTSAMFIADITACLLAVGTNIRGVRHLTTSGQTTWYEFARSIVASMPVADRAIQNLRIEPVPSAQYPTPARRPAYSVLDNSMLANELGMRFPSWSDAFASVLATAP